MTSQLVDLVWSTKVPKGIVLVFYGLELTALAIVLMLIVPLLLSPPLALGAIFALAIVFIVAVFMSIVGKCLCLTAPETMRGKTAIYLAVAFDLAALLLTIAGFLVTLPPVVSWATSLLGLAGFGCFVLFLRSLGMHVRSKELARKATRQLPCLVAFAMLLVFWNIGGLGGHLLIQISFVPPGLLLLFALGISLMCLAVTVLIGYSRLLLAFKKSFEDSGR